MSSLQYPDRVKQYSTSTGAGDIAFSATIPGFNAFSTIGSAPFPYEIHAIDGSGIPTGQWETGIGKISGGNLIRIAPDASSSGSVPLSFSAGTKVVSLCIPSTATAGMRRANTTYYVRPGGSNSNSGLVNDDGGAFLTIQHALNVAAADMIISGSSDVSIYVETGSYAEYLVLPQILRAGSGRPKIVGNGSGPTDVVVRAVSAEYCGDWILQYFSIANVEAVSNYNALQVGRGASLECNAMDFGSAGTGRHVFVRDGGRVLCSDYTVGGGGKSHIKAEAGGSFVFSGSVITFTASATFSEAVVQCLTGAGHVELTGVSFDVSTYSATVTGKRYDINGNGVCNTGGGGASFVPGTVAGTTATGGQYM
ncbi:hypothetical protein [Dokdonella sp.]|uniref:hypothetical protein n=1 Tax=Dokdonella sp. TaxID=2291710 RepID=UPI002DD6857D|nr:hypothetical protein [Dokdonella sp.]